MRSTRTRSRSGTGVRGADVLALLAGEVRPEMVRALDRVKEAGYRPRA